MIRRRNYNNVSRNLVSIIFIHDLITDKCAQSQCPRHRIIFCSILRFVDREKKLRFYFVACVNKHWVKLASSSLLHIAIRKVTNCFFSLLECKETIGPNQAETTKGINFFKTTCIESGSFVCWPNIYVELMRQNMHIHYFNSTKLKFSKKVRFLIRKEIFLAEIWVKTFWVLKFIFIPHEKLRAWKTAGRTVKVVRNWILLSEEINNYNRS